MKKTIIVCLMVLGVFPTLRAQKEKTPTLISTALKGYNFFVRAGYVIGGTSPIPLTEEIRSLEGYSPGLRMSIEGNIQKKFNPKWGLMAGLRLESKGMNTEAIVKNYGMDMWQGGERMVGYFTGTVKTNVDCGYLSIPVMATYDLSSRWTLKAGPYLSWTMRREFTGSVYDGYLRVDEGKMEGTTPTGPTGQKIEITANNPATYDFTNDLRRFQWGMEIGAEWRALKYLNVYAHLDWGLNSAFKSDFDVVTFSMFPIYATMGFGYAF